MHHSIVSSVSPLCLAIKRKGIFQIVLFHGAILWKTLGCPQKQSSCFLDTIFIISGSAKRQWVKWSHGREQCSKTRTGFSLNMKNNSEFINKASYNEKKLF